MRAISIVTLFLTYSTTYAFSPNTNDFDAYGIRIAVNDILFVQANSIDQTFFVQLSHSNNTRDNLQCQSPYAETDHYVYSVGVGIKQNTINESIFYFFGEVIIDADSSTSSLGRNRTFIGFITNRNSLIELNATHFSSSLSCDIWSSSPAIEFLSNYNHQEYSVMGVEPYGQYALVMATDFIFRYQPFSTQVMKIQSGNETWPKNTTFYPAAIDVSETFTIVAGFLRNSLQARLRVTPTVYLMSNDNFTIRSSWSYTPTNNSWQSRLTYSNIASWNKRYTMSVKINPFDARRVLVGMPFLNTVFMFVVENSGTRLRLTSSDDRGASTGYGKSVTWLAENQAGVLDWSYTLDGRTFRSSAANVYRHINGTLLDRSFINTIPNVYQPIPSIIAEEWIRTVSTSSSLVIMDVNGATMMFLPESSGYYASTDMNNVSGLVSMPLMSYSVPCPSGTYKADRGVHPCGLCPSGTRSPGGIGAVRCISCSSESYCPLGAVFEVSLERLTDLSQASAYPRTPDVDVFEDILLNNMFLLTSPGRCLVVSPIFWVLILLCIILILLIGMGLMNLCMKREQRDKWQGCIKSFFRQTDFIGEGELWLGGLATFAVILMTIMAYYFAISFMYQYPAETVGPSKFACDETLRNAKYSSTLQSLAVPISEEETDLFNMLDAQNFTLSFDLINTVATCDTVRVEEIVEDSTITRPLISCLVTNGTLSASVALIEQDSTIVIANDGFQLVGGLRLGISGAGLKQDVNTLQELNFRRLFVIPNRTLALTTSIRIEMTKAINETESLSNGGSIFSGIWYPTFTFIQSNMFATADTYLDSVGIAQRTITITLFESSYFIKNTQSPIARQPEIVFRTLLFAFLCLEFCVIGFLLCKLIILPIIFKIYHLCRCRRETSRTVEEPTRSRL